MGVSILLLLLLRVSCIYSEDTTKLDVATTVQDASSSTPAPVSAANSTALGSSSAYIQVLESCCIMPDILNMPNRVSCANQFNLTMNDTKALNENECFLKCIIDSNGISNGDSINNGPLLEILNNNLPSKLKPIWMRPLHNAIFTCLDKSLAPVTPTPPAEKNNCTSVSSYLFGCLYTKMAEKCPLYAIDTSKPECVDLRYTALNVTKAP